MRALLAIDGSISSDHARDLAASLAWPEGLAVIYPYPMHGVPLGQSAAAGVLLALVTLDGLARTVCLIFLAGLAVKTLIGRKAGW